MAEKTIKQQVDAKLNLLKDAGASQKLYDETKKWLLALRQQDKK